MLTKATQPTQPAIKRARPIRDSLGAVADGVTRTIPEVADLVVEATKATRLVATTIRLTMGEVVMEQLLDTMELVETTQKERGYSSARMAKLAELSGMEDIAKLIQTA